MIKDKISEIYDALMSDEELSKITIKSFERPETLPTDQTSIVIIPLGPPIQSDQGSNTSRIECKKLQGLVEKVMESQGFYQIAGGLDEWIPEIKRYADARTYKGKSKLYDDY